MPKTWTWNRPASLADLQDNRVFTWKRLSLKADLAPLTPEWRPTLIGVAPPSSTPARTPVVRVSR